MAYSSRSCPTCSVVFSPEDNRAVYCSVKCRNNAPNKKTRTREFQRKRKEMLNALKLSNGCKVCGYNEHPAALHFNHVCGDKLFNISQDSKKAWGRIIEEVAKCEVLCANCHSVHTYENRHWHSKRKNPIAPLGDAQ